MGAEVQQKCEECLNCSNANDIEFKKDENNNPNFDLSKNLRSKGLRPYENDMTFIENDIAKAVTIIINPKIYEKMLNGEKLHLILEPLTNFNNKNLYEIIRELFIKMWVGASPSRLEIIKNLNKEDAIRLNRPRVLGGLG